MGHRGTTNSNSRGNSRDRAARRAWLLSPAAGWGGDGEQAPCYRCGTQLVDSTITVDRIVPGVEDGTYRRGNIRPACGPCNSSTGAYIGHARRYGFVTA